MFKYHVYYKKKILMLKKTLLKNTHEFLKKNFSENFFLLKKSNKKRKNLLLNKGSIVKKKLFKFKEKNFKLSDNSFETIKNTKEKFHDCTENRNYFHYKHYSAIREKSENLYKTSFVKKDTNFLVSMHMVKSEFEKKQTRNSDFKNKLKEKKKLSILYGNISNKQINKILQKTSKLQGNTGDNLLVLLEKRLDVILYRALFFSTIKSARQWIRCNKILVNSRCINIPSYQLNFGDIICITSKNKKIIGNEILKFFLDYNLFLKNNFVKMHNFKKNKYLSLFSLAIHSQKKFIFKLPSTKVSKYNSLNLYKNIILNDRFLPKLKKKKQYNKNICENSFRKTHHYFISMFFFTLLENQVKPINKFLFKQIINKLFKIFKVNDFIFYTKQYKIFKQNNLFETKIPDNSLSLLNLHSLIYKEKLNTEIEILNSFLNKKITQQTNEIIHLLLNSKSVNKRKEKYHINQLVQLNSFKYCDLLFFLKLKSFFFIHKNTQHALKKKMFDSVNFLRKIHFKPLNIEVSYKTLTIIHLYPSQKIVFPCSLDTGVLLKNYI